MARWSASGGEIVPEVIFVSVCVVSMTSISVLDCVSNCVVVLSLVS